MRKLGDEASDRREAREKEAASAGESAREMRAEAVERPLQKLIEKIVGSRTGKEEARGGRRQIGDDDNTR